METKNIKVVPFAAVVVVLVILVPVFVVMTADRIQRQEELVSQQLLEKGISLTRTFEAGTRTGMLNMRWGARRIQMLLTESALQPDVAYMMITDPDGRILAHSDPDQIGNSYRRMPSLSELNHPPAGVYHRVASQDAGQDLYEVFKRFEPVRGRMEHGPGRMHRMRMVMENREHEDSSGGSTDWSRPYLDMEANDGTRVTHYLIAGLSMKKVDEARDRLVKETLFQAVVYFLLVFAGMSALFVFQAYRSARASLSSVKAYSDTVIQNMPAGLVTTDANGNVTAMNTAAVNILGRKSDRIHPQMEMLINELNENRTIINREINIETGSDNTILLDLTLSALLDSDQKQSGFLFLFKDLTQINELKQQLETNKRLAAIGKLAAGVAHEIRNPLSSIKGFATYFGRRYKDNDSDRETAQIMVDEVDRLNRSITQLLEFAKPMSVEKKRVNLEALINHSLKLISRDMETARITADIDLQTGRTDIVTDEDRVTQVLLNLYMNALQAMAPGGTLEIKVSEPDKSRIAVDVCDDGCGMDEGVLEGIFDPYFTTKPTGTGLGLSIAHRIMEKLGGSICVESAPGAGTCFKLFFPINEVVDE
jgi:two-component system sensor histidine kinase HydH